MKKVIFLLIFSLAAFFSFSAEEEKGGFNPGELIMHHIQDAHEWHFFTWIDEAGGEHHISLPLPVILYAPGKGLEVFSSFKFHNPSHTYKGYKLDHGHIEAVDGSKVYDFSITKTVASMMVSMLLLVLIFISVARGYQKRKKGAPKGMQSLIEPIVIFIRDEVAKPNIGEKKYARYMPFLLTLFFFIWLNNLLGLLPAAANVTGNIAITFTLASITLLVILFSGNKHYWGHIFAPPGVPGWLLPIMIPIEIVGVFVKPFALMVRLFANITAGHIVILSIISLIFIFSQQSPALGLGVSPVSIAFTIFMYFLELLVAALQAYIFTILAALFIGDAVTEPEHH